MDYIEKDFSKRGKSVKLCLIAPAPQHCGGISNWTRIVCKQIEKEKSKIEFSFINIAPTTSCLERRVGLGYLWTSSRELFIQLKNLLHQIKISRPDIIHLTTSGGMSFIRDYVLTNVMKRFDIPFVYHIHFGRVPQIIENRKIEYWIMSRVLSRTYRVIAIDPKTYECFQKQFPSVKSVYIPNPVEKSEFMGKDIQSKKEILYVGWIIKSKGIEELICAWNNIKGKFPDYSLHLLGPYNEEYKTYLHNKYNLEKVVMEGELTHEMTLERIQECSILLLPSYTEGFPNVILEAMMAKKPIIATRVGAIPEMLSENAGILIDAKQTKQIEEELYELISNPNYQEEIAKNAYQRAVNLYEIDVVFEQYLDLWRVDG